MKKQLSLEKYLITGVDLRTDEPFETTSTVETKTSVESYFQQRGYRVSKAEFIGFHEIKLDLDQIYDAYEANMIKLKPITHTTEQPAELNPEPPVPPMSEPPKPVLETEKPLMTVNPKFEEIINSVDAGKKPKTAPNTEPKTTEPKKKGTSGRMYEYLRLHPEQGVIKRIADATQGKLTEDNIRDMINGKAQCGRWFTTVGLALDILEAEPMPAQEVPTEPTDSKKTRKGVMPNFFGEGNNPEGLGEIDEAKFRIKTQAALKKYVAKHGDKFSPIIKATTNRVTEETIRAILADSDAGRLVHVQAVNKALKKLDIEDAARNSDSRGYDMT